jgi:WD40 repeat protein
MIKTLAIGFSDEVLATAGTDRTIKIWSLKDQRVLNELKGHSGIDKSS